jgi:hypothetical protein
MKNGQLTRAHPVRSQMKRNGRLIGRPHAADESRQFLAGFFFVGFTDFPFPPTAAFAFGYQVFGMHH